jgi:hypothetical protein
MDAPYFQLPAAASIFLFFFHPVGGVRCIFLFSGSWSIPFLVLLFFLNILYRYEIIDPTNKAYGLNYTNQGERPEYSQAHLLDMCSPERVAADKKRMLLILENWKKNERRETHPTHH